MLVLHEPLSIVRVEAEHPAEKLAAPLPVAVGLERDVSYGAFLPVSPAPAASNGADSGSARANLSFSRVN